MSSSRFIACVLVAVAILVCADVSRGELTEDQAERIEAAVPKEASVKPKKARRVLIWNTPFIEKCPHKGYSVPQGEYAMKLLGEKTGAYEAVVSDDVAMYLPENLARFDAIIMNNSNGPWIRPVEGDMGKFAKYGGDIDSVEKMLRKSLLDWISGGGGIVAYHHAIGGNTHWPKFLDMLGAGYWGHPWNEEVGVKVEEPSSRMAAAFGGKDFRISEEVFQYREPYSRDKVRVLLSLDTETSNMKVPWIHRTDGDFALAWVKSYGKGRVFYGAFGHRSEIWWNEAILRFYLDGIQFAVGDLQVDTTPSAKVGVEEGFVSLFNGRDLSGWRGNPRLWTVRDGAITGETTEDNRISENTFLIWAGGDVKDFELRLKFRLESGNSGIYYRSRERAGMEREVLAGPQADIGEHRWTGVIMEYTMREILAERGQKVLIDEKGRRSVVGSVGEAGELLEVVKDKQWNDYTIVARGGHVVLKINGRTMCELEDNDPRMPRSGKLALQIHRGPDMLVQFKDIRLRGF